MVFSKFELLKSLEFKNQKYFELYQHFKFNPVQGPKGQTKSKWFFQADISSQKRTNEFDFTTMIPQVDLFSFCFFFLEEIEDTKKTFRN